MTRALGIRNCTSYRYRVTNAEGKEALFVSQREIMLEFDLKRTAVFYMIHQPLMRRDHQGLVIQLLETQLPVYSKRRVESDAGYTVVYERIKYPVRSPPPPRRERPFCKRCSPSADVSAGSETTALCG